jgi:alpha-1,3-glucosyltransferase
MVLACNTSLYLFCGTTPLGTTQFDKRHSSILQAYVSDQNSCKIVLMDLQSIYSAIALLHLAEILFTPPARYPDLFPVLNALLCSGVFGLAYLWSLKRLVELSWAMGSLRNANSGSAASRTGRRPPSPLGMAGATAGIYSNGSTTKPRDRVASLSSSLRRRNPAGRPTLGVDIPFESHGKNVVNLSESLGMDAS